MINALQLTKLKDKLWYVAPSVATEGTGIFEGLVSQVFAITLPFLLTIPRPGSPTTSRPHLRNNRLLTHRDTIFSRLLFTSHGDLVYKTSFRHLFPFLFFSFLSLHVRFYDTTQHLDFVFVSFLFISHFFTFDDIPLVITRPYI